MQAKDVMTSPVITVALDTPVPDIAELLLTHRISGLPVVDQDGRAVGIISEGDLLRRVETGTDRLRARWLEMLVGRNVQAADFLKTHGRCARDVMSRPVQAVSPDTEIAEIADLMEDKRIKRAPVLVDGRPVGIISRANLLHGLLRNRRGGTGFGASGDEAIRAALLEALEGQSWVDLDRINIVVNDGVVQLWGMVDSEEQRRALHTAASGVSGVKRVEEHLNRNRFVG
ncbi:CBS domain-containing protein [Azospirillum sp. Vi22]|uniref:CBS domain-containing protein n=1 Tax=Azospirillum baldaniorum TaxID=1064539 RepID=UPI00157A64FC|nr:CBS domain-containing protein [Azospirillum baldaniorum]NUB10237.1 CBS domain-containing protein [Azospirillum baldaniorum]